MRGCGINCSCCLRRATVYSVKDLHQPSSGCEKSTCESLPWCEQLYQPTWEVYRKTHRSSGRAFDRWDFAKKIRAQYTSTLFGHVRDGGTSMISWNVEYFSWTVETWSTIDLQLMLDRFDLMTMKKSCQDFVDTKVDARIALLSCRRCVDCQPSAGACSHFNLCRPGECQSRPYAWTVASPFKTAMTISLARSPGLRSLTKSWHVGTLGLPVWSNHTGVYYCTSPSCHTVTAGLGLSLTILTCLVCIWNFS